MEIITMKHHILIHGLLLSLISGWTLKPAESINVVQAIHSFDQAAQALQAATPDTLVLFDIDDTITSPNSKINWAKYKPARRELVKQAQTAKLPYPLKPDKFYSDLWRSADKSSLIEPKIINFIKNLQDRKIPTIALTALYAGPTYFEPYLPEWRLNDLKGLGIDFSKTAFPDMVFHDIPKDQDGNPTAFYHGLLCSSNLPKGQILKVFLERLQQLLSWRPNQIIFFDDLQDNIKSVSEAMREMHIPFYGYLYLGAQDLVGKLNPQIAKTQVEGLYKHNKWLNEQQAAYLSL